MSQILKSKPAVKILLGVTGGIAAYKSADLVRRLKEKSFEVRVVMTESAKNFITPMTMQAVSGNPVHHELFDSHAEAAMGHIELAKWADIILVAPTTANTLSKIAQGIADDLLSTLILASKARLVIVPAMNQQMWANGAILSNVEQLKRRDISLIGPEKGDQACGDTGFGRMSEPLQIVEKLVEISNGLKADIELKASLEKLRGKNIVITAGPTVEAIDPVRFISNHSSGKMGYALAKMAATMGANVTLVSGPVSLQKPERVTVKPVISAAQMFNAVKESVDGCDLFIGCAAIADYTPCDVSDQKIKKNESQMQLTLKRNSDILAWVASQTPRPFVVGFAAESQNLKEFAQKKLIDKNLDMICANDISDSSVGFNSDHNEIIVLEKDNNEIKLPIATKIELAAKILGIIIKKLQ